MADFPQPSRSAREAHLADPCELLSQYLSGDKAALRARLVQNGTSVTFNEKQFGCFPPLIQQRLGEFGVHSVSITPTESGQRIELALTAETTKPFPYRALSGNGLSMDIQSLTFDRNVAFDAVADGDRIEMKNIQGIKTNMGGMLNLSATLQDLAVSSTSQGSGRFEGKGTKGIISSTITNIYSPTDYANLKSDFLVFAEIATAPARGEQVALK